MREEAPTLAHWTGWVEATHIGEPIDPMCVLVSQWIQEGKDVRIFTARASRLNKEVMGHRAYQQTITAIEEWCLATFGVVLPITAEKDHHMTELWDDRAIQVVTNTGNSVQEEALWLITNAGLANSKLTDWGWHQRRKDFVKNLRGK